MIVLQELTAASRDRVKELLARTPQHEVVALPEEEFRHHRQAGPLFERETVEVI